MLSKDIKAVVRKKDHEEYLKKFTEKDNIFVENISVVDQNPDSETKYKVAFDHSRTNVRSIREVYDDIRDQNKADRSVLMSLGSDLIIRIE